MKKSAQIRAEMLHTVGITFADVVWSTENGDPLDKPADVEYLEDTAATNAFGRGTTGNKRPRKGVVTFAECVDPEELIQLTFAKLQP